MRLVEGPACGHAQVPAELRVHGEELERAREDRADRVSARVGLDLVSPKEPAEKTRDRTASPSRPSRASRPSCWSREERIDRQLTAITNVDDKTIAMFFQRQVVSEPVKKALAEIVRRKQRIEQTVAQRQQLEQRIRDIEEDQVADPPEHGPARP